MKLSNLPFKTALLTFVSFSLLNAEDLKVNLVEKEGQAKKEEPVAEIVAPKETASSNQQTFDAPPVDPPPILPKNTKKTNYKIFFPEYERAMRNLMSPIPLPNNPQVYPFMLTIPMEGADLLPVKAIEFSVTQHFLKGSVSDQSARYQIDMNQRYFEQTFGMSIGLPKKFQLGLSIPLYHFDGDNLMTKDGITMIGPLGGTRNFWGALTLNLKHLYYEDKAKGVKSLFSAYFQFPEGNQRGRGGTSSGHWAINTILEKQLGERRLHLNLGLTQAGSLRLLNSQTLDQGVGWFLGASLSQKVTPTSAVELQLHFDQNGLGNTDLDELTDVQSTIGAGYRLQIKESLDSSIAVFTGIDSPVKGGVSLDLKYTW